MKKREIPKVVRGRWPAIWLGTVLAMLAILCLGVLAFAQAPSVTVTKTVTPTETDPGTPIQYSVIFTNSSGTDQDIEIISDTLPADFAFLSVVAGSDILSAPMGITGTIVWSGFEPNTVPAGDSLSLIYSVLADAPTFGSYENYVQARLEGGEVITAAATVTLLGVEISGTKAASVPEVRIGDPLQYQVTLTNGGNVTASLSSIVDTLPPDFGFDGMISGLPEPDVVGNELTWAGPIEIAAGDVLTFHYQVIAGGAAGATPSNSVLAMYDDETAGPYSAQVLLLADTFYVYVPLLRTAEYVPPPTDFLAYDSYTEENFEILTIASDGSNRFNVSNEAGGDSDPDWSPDGSKLAWIHFYDGKGDILVSNADGTDKVNLTNHPKDDRAPAWSPDGTKIAFHSLREEDRREVYVMNADGSDVTRLTYHMCQSHSPLWSPDGTKIAYLCGLDQPSEGVSYLDVFVMDADGQNFSRLTHDEVPDEAMDWSPDGKYIAYVHYDGLARKKSDIWVVDIDTGTRTQLTFTDGADYAPAWSPDGTKIAFSTYLDGSYEIALMDPDGTNIVNLTQAPEGDYLPRWSADGTKIAFLSFRDGDRGLYVMNADGSGQMRLDSLSPFSIDTSHVLVWAPR